MAFARLSSSRQALVGVGEQGSVRPRSGSWTAYPTVGKALKYEVSAAVMLRIADAAEDSLADILARSRFGIAIAAMIKMIATTISNSIKEKPFCFRIICPRLRLSCDGRLTISQVTIALCLPEKSDGSDGWGCLQALPFRPLFDLSNLYTLPVPIDMTLPVRELTFF